MSDVNAVHVQYMCRVHGHLHSSSPHARSSLLLLKAALQQQQQQPFAACHVTAAFTSRCAVPPLFVSSLFLLALSFSLAKPALTWGCSSCLPACLPAADPTHHAMCHSPSLPATLLAKDMLWHSCLPPLRQSCRFGLLCTLLMWSSCRDPAPHRRSK